MLALAAATSTAASPLSYSYHQYSDSARDSRSLGKGDAPPTSTPTFEPTTAYPTASPTANPSPTPTSSPTSVPRPAPTSAS